MPRIPEFDFPPHDSPELPLSLTSCLNMLLDPRGYRNKRRVAHADTVRNLALLTVSYSIMRDGLKSHSAGQCLTSVDVQLNPGVSRQAHRLASVVRDFWQKSKFELAGRARKVSPLHILRLTQLHPVLDDPRPFVAFRKQTKHWSHSRQFRTLFVAGRIRNVRWLQVCLDRRYDLTLEASRMSVARSGVLCDLVQDVVRTLEMCQLSTDREQFGIELMSVFSHSNWALLEQETAGLLDFQSLWQSIEKYVPRVGQFTAKNVASYVMLSHGHAMPDFSADLDRIPCGSNVIACCNACLADPRCRKLPKGCSRKTRGSGDMCIKMQHRRLGTFVETLFPGITVTSFHVDLGDSCSACSVSVVSKAR